MTILARGLNVKLRGMGTFGRFWLAVASVCWQLSINGALVGGKVTVRMASPSQDYLTATGGPKGVGVIM
eukprot:jgi/Botrbrau1/11030/Bobra.92_2s0003.1